MATINILGQQAAIVSALTPEEFGLLRKYRPASLRLTDPETKEDTFVVEFVEGSSGVGKYGIIFGGVTNVEPHRAVCYVSMPAGVEDPAAYVADELGAPLMQLNRIEGGLRSVLAEIDAERATVRENITVTL